ncbi:hypothetical protein F5X68DRAFT_278627 [Plectosphaerella plurivora]|uniref:Uncharacterized protein n=1 Tax=Plectosphaerella plurivora TaxID=936078 RepID=A0A9P8V485_9PEZI|nr:hypothetical protein F5X68DRAFT_278627 [Plectosphaerella plurivora]
MQSTILDPTDCVRHGSVHCPSAGKLLASMYNFKGARNVPYSQVWNFTDFSDCSGGYNLTTVVSFYDAWASHLPRNEGMMTDFRKDITDMHECRLAFCKALDFSGNADFAGIGVIVSFGIQICIATFFAVFCLCCLFRPDTIGKNWKAFRNTFDAFFISSVYFNVAICIAATATIALEKKTQHTAIFTTLGLLLSLSTLWITLLVLCAEIIKVTWDSNFELFCFHHLAARPFAEKLLLAPIGLVAFGLILAVLKPILKYKLTKKEVEHQWRWVERATVVAGIILMWFVFGTLWVLRAQVGDVAGEGYQDNNWGFGQVAAVATWLPTLVIVVQDTFGLMTAKGSKSISTSRPKSDDDQLPTSGNDESSAEDGSGQEPCPPKTVPVVHQDAVSVV